MKPLLYLTYFWGLSLAAKGQDSTIALRRTSHIVAKFAPLSLLDQDATIQAGLEYRTGARTSVQGEFGYGRKGLSLSGSDLNKFINAEVWRGRAEVRFYTGQYRTNRRQGIAIRSDFPLGNYWAIEGLFKRINVTDKAYGYQPIFSSSSPRYIGLTNTSRYVVGSHVKIGRQFGFYDPSKRIFSRTLIDIYIGAGMRWAINDILPSTPQPMYACGCVTTFSSGLGRSFSNLDGKLSPSIAAGLKLGFAL
ncbi:MAG: hypothetical protein JWP57_481 [Spirosoma sp.]|nr:hypothetical protein [Spirosoma sp.]